MPGKSGSTKKNVNQKGIHVKGKKKHNHFYVN